MDSLSLILEALVAGVAAGGQATASEVVKDGYHQLKSLIQHKLANQPGAVSVLTKHEEEPAVWEGQLKEILTDVAADQDEAIIQAAQHLLNHLYPQQAAAGKFNVQNSGTIQSLIQSDHAHVTITFDDQPKERKK